MRRQSCPKCGKVAPLFHGAERPNGNRYEVRTAGMVRLCTECFCDWLDAEVVSGDDLTDRALPHPNPEGP